MSETIKKHVEKILKTSATVAIVGATAFSQVAKAEEVEEVVAIETTDAAGTTGEDTALTVPEAEAKKAVAQSEVEQVQEQKAQADQAVEAAQTKLDEDKKALAEATAAREQAEVDFIKAEEIAKDLAANPDKPAEIAKEIEAKTEEVEKAKTAEKEVKGEVEAQTKVVEAAKAEATKAEQAVVEAKKQVEELENSIQDSEKVEGEKTATDSSITILQNEISALEQQVATATETAKAEAEAELKKKQSELTAKQAELEALQKEHGTTVTTQGATIDTATIMGGNTLTLNNYPYAQVLELEKSGYNGSVTYNQVVNKNTDYIVAQTRDEYAANQYKTIEADTTRQINPDELTTEVQNELAIFAATLVNGVRKQLGLSELEVVAGAQDLARRMTTAYKAKYGETQASGVHDQELMSQLATQAGLTATDYRGYENVAWWGNATTVDQAKSAIYNTISYMLFNDQDSQFGHTVNFLRSDSDKVYLGLSTLKSAQFQYHVLMIPSTQVVTPSLFDTTSISKQETTTTVDKSAEIATITAEISALKTTISELNGVINNPTSSANVTVLANQVSAKREELAALQAKSAELATRLGSLEADKAGLEAELTVAKAALAQAQNGLTNAQETLAAKEAELAKFNDKLVVATSTVVGLENEVIALQSLLALYNNPNLVEETDAALSSALDAEEQAQAKVAADEKELESAQAVQAEVETLLATKLVALEEATALLETLIAEYEGLLVDRDEEGIHAVLDENLTEDELPVFEIPADGKAPEVETGTGAAFGSTTGTGVAGGAAVQKLTNNILTAKKAASSATKTAAQGLPKTGDKSTLVATVLGSMMMSSAALAGYKRRKED